MVQIMSNDYGNPSSTHGFGRSAKSILELSRKSIAKHFNVSAQEIILLLRTESNNDFAICSSRLKGKTNYY
jgi:cysteine desulfurase